MQNLARLVVAQQPSDATMSRSAGNVIAAISVVGALQALVVAVA